MEWIVIKDLNAPEFTRHRKSSNLQQGLQIEDPELDPTTTGLTIKDLTIQGHDHPVLTTGQGDLDVSTRRDAN